LASLVVSLDQIPKLCWLLRTHSDEVILLCYVVCWPDRCHVSPWRYHWPPSSADTWTAGASDTRQTSLDVTNSSESCCVAPPNATHQSTLARQLSDNRLLPGHVWIAVSMARKQSAWVLSADIASHLGLLHYAGNTGSESKCCTQLITAFKLCWILQTTAWRSD